MHNVIFRFAPHPEQNPDSSLSELGAIISKDPVLTAHFIRLANSALFYTGRKASTVADALMRLGIDRAKLHIWALSARHFYSSPSLRKIWNHSVEVAQTAGQYAESTRLDPNEAMLAALVHDIGRIVLARIPGYLDRESILYSRGRYLLAIERTLCGMDHAEVGAELLLGWNFAPDIAEAVRHHHAPSASTSALTYILYLAESWCDDIGEGIYDPIEHARISNTLGLPTPLKGTTARQDVGLEVLRFAA